MSIKYRMTMMNDNINVEGEKKTSYYPTVVRRRTVTLEDLCRRATHGTTLSPVEMEIAIKMMVQHIEWELLDSNHVCIDGFGTFSVTAESRPVDDPDDIRAASIGLKRMIFKPSKIFMRKLKNAVFERAK